MEVQFYSYIQKFESFLAKIHFIHAGGYDLKNVENLEHKVELEQCAKELGLVEGPTGDFQLLTDLSNDEKVYLLQQSDVTLYTPIGEHFGIVPLESMAASTPVVAMASGKKSDRG